jgi:hypothetical protein
MPQFQKYLFKGTATALRGRVRKPYYQELGHHCDIATYAGTSGLIESVTRHFTLVNGDIKYDTAATKIEAEDKRGDEFRCTVTSTVKDLWIFNRFHVKEVTAKLTSVYFKSDYTKMRLIPRISPAGSTIKGATLDGKELDMKLPDVFSHGRGEQEAFFHGEMDKAQNLRDVYEPPKPPDSIPGDNFGNIYYAEWAWVHPGEKHRQHIGMLRLALGSDSGGDVDVSLGGNDGSAWPPLAG